MSEPEAYLRIAVARAARQHPVLLEMLGDGRLHLSGIVELAPHLTAENRDALLARAVHKSKRQIEELVAEIAPRPDVPAGIRRMPSRPMTGEPAEGPTVELRPDGVPPLALAGPAARPVVEPLSPARYKVQFTAGAELYEKLERLRALLRHEVPDGDLAAVIERAVTHELERRDEGQCRFVDRQGRRCPERHRLEYHHRRPFGLGGGGGADNIGLLCRPTTGTSPSSTTDGRP